jgi:aspartate-semialdehyde dehydrogenase
MAKKEYVVGIIGATGAVGVEMMQTLEKRKFPVKQLRLFASERSVGKKLTFRGKKVTVELLKAGVFSGIDFALFSAGASRSKEFAPDAVKAGCVVIDNSSFYRMDPSVPLVVPEVNPDDVFQHKGIIANPNCCTAVMLVAVYPLHKVNPIRRIVVSTYQAASGAGAKAMTELEEQTRAVLGGKKNLKIEALPQRIAFNLFPHVDMFLDSGYTKEEMKFMNESRKIMHSPDLQVSATCVRVPVMRAHSEAVNMEFTRPMTPAKVRAILAKSPGVQVVDDPAGRKYPMPINASGMYDVLAGRIRQDCSRTDGRGIEMFVSGDQLLKGAALNAVQIAEVLIRK